MAKCWDVKNTCAHTHSQGHVTKPCGAYCTLPLPCCVLCASLQALLRALQVLLLARRDCGRAGSCHAHLFELDDVRVVQTTVVHNLALHILGDLRRAAQHAPSTRVRKNFKAPAVLQPVLEQRSACECLLRYVPYPPAQET